MNGSYYSSAYVLARRSQSWPSLSSAAGTVRRARMCGDGQFSFTRLEGKRVPRQSAPHVERLQQELATPNTISTDRISSRRHRDVGNVAKSEIVTAVHRDSHLSSPIAAKDPVHTTVSRQWRAGHSSPSGQPVFSISPVSPLSFRTDQLPRAIPVMT